MEDLSVSYSRRLPVYLVLDVSRSMRGEPIRWLNDGLRLLHQTLLANPAAVEVAYLSIITYSTEPRQVIPLTALTDLVLPELAAGGWSGMGAALTLLNDALDREILLNAPGQKGDYRPLVFLLTDGHPTDGWKRASKRLRDRAGAKLGVFVALGCGPNADLEVLAAVADVALSMKEMTPERLNGFFKWISQSIGTASQSSSTPTKGSDNLPALPAFLSRIGV